MVSPRILGAALPWLPLCAALASTYAAADASPPASPARALVYPQNPVRTPSAQLLQLALEPEGPALRHRQLVAQSCVDQGKTATVASKRTLRVCTPVSSARADDRGAYTTPPSTNSANMAPDAFAEAMLFHHAARTLVYFEALKLPSPTDDAPLRLVANVRMPAEYVGKPATPNALSPWPDALFVPAREAAEPFRSMLPGPGDTIWFGEGPTTRFAYDGDVVVHEVTHALLAPLLPDRAWYVDEQGASAAHTAIDEGLADYFAAALNGDPVMGEYVAQDAALWQQRNLDVAPRCPQALVGRGRADSLLLSSALWSLRRPLAPAAAKQLDRALVSGLVALRDRETLSFERLLEGVLSKLAITNPALARTARRELSRRGLLPGCTRVLTLGPAQSLAGQTDSFVAPGTHALATQTLAPGVLQLRVQIPAGTRVVRLRFRAGGSQSPPLEPTERTAFRPVVLSKRDKPIRWTDGSHDADHVQELALAALCTARIEVEGARELYAQIANAGEQDGFYDDLAVAFEP